MKNKFRTRLAVIFMSAFLMLGLLVIVPACGGQNSGTDFTVEQHIRWASSAVQFQFVDSGDFESFEIHPIYNGATGAFSNFLLVEFAPIGFMYVKFFRSEGLPTCGGVISSAPAYEMTKPEYSLASHFCKIANEQRYFFILPRESAGPLLANVIPAIRYNNSFLNLLSNEIFSGALLETQKYTSLSFSYGWLR